MTINLLYLLLPLAIFSLRAYLLMVFDKRKAIKKEWRTPERTLFLAAVMGGTLGIWLGMLPPVNHKKSKLSFVAVLVLITVLQLALSYWVAQNYGQVFYFENILF